MSDTQNWRDNFQEKFHRMMANGYLQLTCGTCNPDGSVSQNKTKTSSMVMDNNFLFLELVLFWGNSGRL